MAPGRALLRGLRRLFRPVATEQDLRDEVQHYLDEAVDAHRAAGLGPEEALRAARLELGGATQVREQIRGAGWEQLLESLVADVRHGVRRLLAEPGFTAVTVLTLALGLGASTAILGVVHPVLFQPLPYPGADRIVTVWDRGADGAAAEMTYGSFLELEARSHAPEALAVTRTWQPTLTGGSEPERLEGQRVSAGFFAVLGVSPTLGRGFEADDDRPDAGGGVILADRLWRRRFGADPGIIGRQVTISDQRWTVLGVMPAGFENLAEPAAEIWAPLQYDLSQGRAWGHHLRVLARAREGLSAADVAGELETIARNRVSEFPRRPWAAMADGLLTVPLREQVTAAVRPALLAILGAVALLLVIACVNVTNLLLARGVRRRGEFAVRAALGAGRGRLVRQLLTEHLLLALCGGFLGLVLARLGVRALVAWSPPELGRLAAIELDRQLFGFGLALTALTGLTFGSVAALQAAGERPQGTLQLASRRTTGSHRRTRGVLVVTQVALALVLLVASGLLLRSLSRLFAVQAGFEPAHLLTLQVQTSGHRFSEDSTTYRFFGEALEAVRAVPGVSAAALTSQLPLSGDVDLYGVHFDAGAPADSAETHGTFRYTVSPGYFETMGIPLRKGRLLDQTDQAGAAPSVVISESMARRRLPGLDPVGRRLRIGEDWAFTIVGVVGDVRQVSLAVDDADAVYVTGAQWHFADRVMSLVVRTRTDAATIAPVIRRAIWSVDRDQAIIRVATMTDLVAQSAAERRFALMLFEAFALSALVLAAAGIYGVLSGSVAERTREIGVRAALGATRGSILSLILRQGMTLTATGAGLGLVGAGLATRFIASMLFDVSPLDPPTYLLVLGLLAGVSLVACAVPAWRAARVDPVRTLRAE